jgi:hypothetical protein
MTSNLEAFVAKLNTIDFGPIAHQLIHHPKGPQWSKYRTQSAIQQYQKFLFLHYQHPDRDLSPNATVDQVWHCHILDPEKYISDCIYLFGYILHHYPYQVPQVQE